MPTVRVPASSANLGPGFDAIGLALTTYLDFDYPTTPTSAATERTDETNLAVRTFRATGGVGDVSVHAQFAGGRGLGYSGAARVAGIMAARLQQESSECEARELALAEAAALEGHADNVSAALLGGVVATGAGHAVRIPLGFECAVVVWIPQSETSTKSSRTKLADTVAFDDAVFNVSRVALLVAALTAGRTDALRDATQDRLHQDRRLAAAPASRAVLTAALDAGAWCAWLSGSGPSVAALCEPGAVVTTVADAAARATSETGRAVELGIDTRGAHVR